MLSDSWFGVLARADVAALVRAAPVRAAPVRAAPVRAAHERAWLGALARPEVRGRLEELGYTVLAQGSDAFGARIRRYAETYAGVIRQADIRVD